METKKVVKVTFEYEDGTKTTIEGYGAVLIQARINSSGIMAGIEVTEE
jgi:hypothetical protein